MTEIRESVIFMVRRKGHILCEWRQFRQIMRHCILGGKVEEVDHQSDDFKIAAVRRELKEEVGLELLKCRYISSFIYQDYPFHLMLVEAWQGPVPTENSDNNNPLHWVEQYELAASISLEPLKVAVDQFLASGI